MQVEATHFSASSPLSSLVESSNPSIDSAPHVGARAKVTYSRKPNAPEESEPTSSSRPGSPSDHLFDSPMRSYSRIAALRTFGNAADQDANDVTVTAEASPATTTHAANSAVKPGVSSLFRRNESHPSQRSDEDDDEDVREQSSRDSPAVNSGKKFQLGMARAIFDSDSEDESAAVRVPTASQSRSRDKDDDDDAIIARIRAQTVHDPDSDPFTGSLSSLTSSQAQSSLQRSSSGLHKDDQMEEDRRQEDSTTMTRRRGDKISAMRGKSSKPQRSKFSSSSDQEGGAPSEEDGDPPTRKSRTFKLASSPSSSSAIPPADDGPEAGPSTVATALSRREKMEALAAKARLAHGDVQTEPSAEADPLLDAFFGGGSPGRIPSRSPSLDIQSSDDDEHNDAMPSFMASVPSSTKDRSKKSKPPVAERDILSDLEDDAALVQTKTASNRGAASKGKAPPKVKPLSKKEVEIMHRQTARIARENRPRLAPTHQRKTIGLGELLSKITASEALRTNSSQGASGSNTPDGAAGEDQDNDPSPLPSSQIPSGQSKSQHASDPIESDPIPERSSPHANYSSSPVVAVSRQQERRLGLDQFISPANALQTHSSGGAVAGRVAGLATRPEETARTRRLLSGAEDDEGAELQDLASIIQDSRDRQEAQKEAADKQQQLREMKLRLLEKSRQQQPSSETKTEGAAKPKVLGGKPAQASLQEEDEDDLILYKPGSVLAQKHNLPATPGKKRPTDLLYREIGIPAGKTPPTHASYVGVNADGSPNRTTIYGSALAENAQDPDELVVTDAQLRNAGRGLFIASDQAAGHGPATHPEPTSTQVREDDTHPLPSATQASARAGPLKMTQAELNATLMRKVQSQSLKARSQKEVKDALAKADKHGRAAAPDVKALLQRLGGAVDASGQDQARDVEADEDEDDPDFIMPAARDAESVIGSDVDMGSASENEAADDAEDLIDMGSADEQEENQGPEETGLRDASEGADEEHDSEKENAPPGNQQSHHVDASPSPGRSLLPSRTVMDDDEDELPAPRANVRRSRRSVLADDDAEQEEDEHALQPGPFDGSGGNAHSNRAIHSQRQPRVPLGDISSQSLDPSMPFSRSNTSSPAIQHAQPPAAASPARRDLLLSSLMTGQDEDESFRTDDIPSQPANDLGRFFEPTLPASDAAKSAVAASQIPQKSFWDQTQTQTQSQSQSQDQDARQTQSSTRQPPASSAPRELARDASGNSALGAFFQETQQDGWRGESLDIFENSRNAGGKAKGFTQFFFEGTPPASAASASNAGPSGWDASTMPPPKSTEVDAFAALRKAQMGEAMDALDTTPSVLPSFDESQAEREAYAQAQADGHSAPMSPEKMYMNRDGFFTQTKPSQQMGLWSQYDSQSQSQSQLQTAEAASGAWRSSAAALGSAPIGSAPVDNQEDEAPVMLKRLRRGVAPQGATEANVRVTHDTHSDADSENDEMDPPSSQPEPRPRNAFDVLRQGRSLAEDDEPVKGTKRKSAFIEGEAEESEDEELGGKKRGDGGGLEGVFADEHGNGSGGDEDEDDEDDADAADLQELVDNERELDEAEKDEIARARFREDMEAQDREDLEIHQRAAQGGYRNRRGRGAGLNGIEGYLDDDADDEELRRRAAMGMHMSAGAKKRKLLDGTEDGMDALAAHDEARAFVQSYASTHRIDHESEKYDFLAVPVADDNDQDSSDDDSDQGSVEDDGGEMHREGHRRGGDGLEEDAFGPVVSKQPSTIGFDEFRAKVRERRKAKQRAALDDDDHDEDAAHRAKDNGWDSDEDDAETRLAAALHDRIKGGSSHAATAPSGQQQKRKPHLGMQYGRKPSRTGASDATETMDIDSEPLPGAEVDEGDDDASSSLMARLLSQPTSRPSLYRQTSSSMAVDTLEDAEPEWGNDANIVRAPKPSAAGTSQSSSSSSSSSLTKLRTGTSTFGAKAEGVHNKKAKVGAASILLSKQGILRRESAFSSSSSS